MLYGFKCAALKKRVWCCTILVINTVSILPILIINRVWYLHYSLKLGRLFRRSYFFIIIGKTNNNYIGLTNNDEKNTIGFFCFVFDKKMPLEKTNVFCLVLRYSQKKKATYNEKEAAQCLIHLNKRTCHIWSCFNIAKFHPFSTEPFN